MQSQCERFIPRVYTCSAPPIVRINGVTDVLIVHTRIHARE